MYGKEEENPDNLLIKNAGSTIVKCVLGLAAFATFGMIFYSCGVSKEDMQECKSVCGTRGMVSVSQWSCQCGWTSSSNDYVIPRSSRNSQPTIPSKSGK